MVFAEYLAALFYMNASVPPVIIFQTFNIVFPEIFPCLHFNETQIDSTAIFYTVG